MTQCLANVWGCDSTCLLRHTGILLEIAYIANTSARPEGNISLSLSTCSVLHPNSRLANPATIVESGVASTKVSTHLPLQHLFMLSPGDV